MKSVILLITGICITFFGLHVVVIEIVETTFLLKEEII